MRSGPGPAPPQDSPRPSRPLILVLSFDPLTDTMPGPAIRAWNLGLQLSATCDVVLAGTAGATRRSAAMDVRSVDGPGVDRLISHVDAVFAPTSVARRHPAAVISGKPLCIDMYIPTHLENLEALGRPGSPEHVAAVAHQVAVIGEDLGAGDFFLCAGERQRDFWLGALASLGRVNPATYGADPTLRSLIDEVPFGLDPAPPPAPSDVLTRAFPAIGPGDPVVIWGGGVYNWFDPLPVLRAVASLRERRPRLRLVFLGMRNPNPDIPEMRVAAELRAESDRLGLTGSAVFFNEGWVPYDQRGAWLASASVGVSTHLDHVETRFSFRTRILDYLWAGVPMVLTGGDTLSESIAAAGLGTTVRPGDALAVAAAIDSMLERPPDREAIRDWGLRFAWDAVARPLVSWAADPRPAPDRATSRSGPVGQPRPAPPAWARRVSARLPAGVKVAARRALRAH